VTPGRQGNRGLAPRADVRRVAAFFREGRGRHDEAREERHVRAPQGLSPASGAGTPPVSNGTAPCGAWRLSATCTTRAARPVVAATPIKTSLVRLRPGARRSAPLPADPCREGNQPSTAAPKEAAFSKLKRFQVVPPNLPRSGLEASVPTLGLKTTFPKSVPPKQTANPRSCTTCADMESLVTGESPFDHFAQGSPCCPSTNALL
jgi:hypothetical protein